MFQLWEKSHYLNECSAPRNNDTDNSNMVSKADFKNLFKSSLKDMLSDQEGKTDQEEG
jgi:hypothetical protein